MLRLENTRNTINCFSPDGTGGLLHDQNSLNWKMPFPEEGMTLEQLSRVCVVVAGGQGRCRDCGFNGMVLRVSSAKV